MGTAKLSQRLSTQDASFLYGESESAPLHFAGLATFDGSIYFAKLYIYMERRLARLPRFRQRLVLAPFNLAHPALQDDPDFQLSNHLFHHQMPEGTDDAALHAAVLRIFEPPMDRSRPLWEMHLFTGLEGNRSAVLWRIHHCIVDGVSWVETLNVMLEPRRDAVAPTPLKPEERKPLPNATQRFVDAVYDLTSMQLRALQRVVSGANGRAKLPSSSAPIANAFGPLLRPTVLAPWNEGIVTKSRAMASLRFPLADVCAIRKAFGGTINDVALSVLGEGASRYLHHHKCDTRRSRLRVGCPVSVRSDDELGTLGNRVSMMVPELNPTPMDPVARLKAVCEETRRIKSSNTARAADLMMSAADLIPPAAMGLASSIATHATDSAAKFASFAPMVARMMRPRVAAINFIATNVAGPRGPVYLAGHQMLDYVGMIPLGGNVGYSVVITTYDQKLLLGLMAAPDLLPDLETMRFFVAQAFDELTLAAKKQLGPEPVIAETAAHPQAA